MGWTKRQFVVEALTDIGFASYIYDAQPELLESIRAKLDAMMATWNAKGIRIGYPIGNNPDSGGLDDATNVPDSANEAIYKNLAIRIAPSVGKTIPQELRQIAKEAYDALVIWAARPMEMQMPGTMPAGAGNKPWRSNNRPFLNPPVEPLLAGPDDEITFE